MALSINEITSGMVLRVEGELYEVVDYNHVKPGKGAAFVRVKLRNMKTGLSIERTFRGSEKLDEALLEEKTVQYLYRSGDTFHFMDQDTYEELAISAEQIGDVVKYLQDSLNVTAVFCDNKLQKVLLPNFLVAKVIETEPGFKGDTSRAGNKPAKIDTGAIVQVPLFINQGDWVKIDTRSASYVERVQK